MAYTKPFSAFGLTLVVACQASATDYETKGNLQPTTELGCASPESVRNTHTPVDLYKSNVECVKRGNYEAAVFSNLVAGVYARFDSMRVADTTAGQAQTVLRMKYVGSLSEDEKKEFMKHLTSLAESPNRMAAMCAEVRKLGPPTYHPSYMIQHGMNAVLGSNAGSGLVQSFDSASSWEKSLIGYLRCSKQQG